MADRSSQATCLPLDHPAYVTTARRGFAGHTFAPSVLTALCASSAVRLLKRFLPSATRAWHASAAEMHAKKAIEHRDSWSSVADEAALQTFGRKFSISDYRISGIGREEFAEEHKDALRLHARSTGKHHRLAVLHHMAAGHRHRTSLQFCQALGL